MHANILGLVITAFVASSSFCQKPASSVLDRSFHFTSAPSGRDFQEIATVLRTVGLISAVSIDSASSSLSISGTPGDIELAGWMIHALDQPANLNAADKRIRDSAVHEYRVPGPKDDVMRMFYLLDIDTPQSMQELITVLRTVGSIRYVYQYTANHGLVIRGTTEQIALATWMIGELDQPPAVETYGIHQFHSSDAKFPEVRAFYLTNRTPKDIQETLTALRMTAHIERAFSHTARAVVIIAGTSAQVEAASRLVAMKDRPSTP